MHTGYIFSESVLPKLREVREQYQFKRNIDLNKKPSRIGLPLFLGGTDVQARNPQIDFLEKMYTILALQKETPPAPLDRNNLLAARTLIAVCLFIMSQLTSGSALKKLIIHALGITESNPLTDEDKRLCFHAAHILITQGDVCGRINQVLNTLGKSGICEHTWMDFEQYVHAEKALFPRPQANHWPCATLGSFIVGQAGYYAAAAAGTVFGGVLSERMVTSRFYLTTAVGTVAVLMNVSPAAAGLAVPVVVHSFLTWFFKISLGHLTGLAGQLLGQGLGGMAGFCGDVALYFLVKSCKFAKYCIFERPPYATGYSLANGAWVCEGMELHSENTAENGDKDKPIMQLQIDIDEKGVAKATLNGEPMVLNFPLHQKLAVMPDTPALSFT